MKGTQTLSRTTSQLVRAEAGYGPKRVRLSWLFDLLIAVGVFLYNLPILPVYATSTPHTAGLLLVSGVLCGAHLLRHRWPLGAVGVMLLAAVGQQLLEVPILAADVMLLFGLYHVATRYLWPVSLATAGLVVAWLLAAVIPHLGDEFIDVGQLGVLVVVTIWVWTWGTLVRTRRAHVAGLRERAEQAERERETLARMAVVDERTRIARELHDVVSHSLTVIIVTADGAARTATQDPERASSSMFAVRDTARTSLADMRRMLGVLREDEPGSKAPQPGIGDLDRLIGESADAGLPVTASVAPEAAALPASVGLTVFRIVQESLTNVRKHAHDATGASVDVRVQGGEVQVRVENDGPAEPRAPEHPSVGGHGLIGMRERVTAHGGTLNAGPRAEGGYAVSAVLPLGGEA